MGVAGSAAVISPALAVAATMPGRWWVPSPEDLLALRIGSSHVKVRLALLEEGGGVDFWTSAPTWVSVASLADGTIRGPIVGGGLGRAGYCVGDLVDLCLDDVFDFVLLGDDGRPQLNVQRALHLLGKHALLASTRVSATGEILEQRQEVAVVRSANDTAIAAETSEGAVRLLPPDTRPFEEAAPGEYRMGASDEIVVDPDYIFRWCVGSPAPLGVLH